MLTIRHKLAALCATAIAMGLVGCQFVAGIANEKPGQGGGGGSTSSASGSSTSTGCATAQCSTTCQDYCDHYFGGTCASSSPYTSLTSCCAACAALDAGEVACRTLHFTDLSNPCGKASCFANSGVPACSSSSANFKRVFLAVCGRSLAPNAMINEDANALLLLAAGPCSSTACLCDQIDSNIAFSSAKTACKLP